MDLTRDLLAAGFQTQAAESERRAKAGIDDLRRGVENAAGTILGDDAEALKLAQAEIDTVTEQLKKEMTREADERGTGMSGGPEAQTKSAAAPSGAEGNGDRKGQELAAGENGRAISTDAAAEKSDALGDAGSPKGDQSGDRLSAQEKQKSRRGKAGADSSKAPGIVENDSARSGKAGVGESGQTSPGSPGAEPSAGGAADSGSPGKPPAGQRSARPRSLVGGPPNAGGQKGGGNFDVGTALSDSGSALGGGVYDPNGDFGPTSGPILGENFAPWADRLRNVEEVLDDPRLRESVAAARERARQMRVEYRRDRKKPDWAVVQLQVLKPLLDVRNRISDELARRDSKESLVPIDRDPVPNRYTDSVARYYESLGKEKPGSQ